VTLSGAVPRLHPGGRKDLLCSRSIISPNSSPGRAFSLKYSSSLPTTRSPSPSGASPSASTPTLRTRP